MEKSSFFNSVGGDRKYKAGEFAEYFSSFIGNGIFPNPSTNLQIIANNDMTVTIKTGKAWINGYFYINTDDLVLPIDVADGVLNRIDRVVVRMDTVAREIKAVVKKGTFASSPIAPVLQRDADIYELGIADMTIGKGATSISQANITDLRMNNSYCGIVKGTVDQIDTTNLFAQYDDAFSTWIQTLEDVLDENTAANLLNLINDYASNITTVSNTLNEHLADTAKHVDIIRNSGKLPTDLPSTYEIGYHVYYEEQTNSRVWRNHIGDSTTFERVIIETIKIHASYATTQRVTILTSSSHAEPNKTTAVYQRSSYANDAWGAWQKTFGDVETGSNANGWYQRYDNGLQICGRTIGAVQPSFIGSTTYEFPAEFVDGAATFVSGTNISNISSDPIICEALNAVYVEGISASRGSKWVFCRYIAPGGEYYSYYNLTAIGRWK